MSTKIMLQEYGLAMAACLHPPVNQNRKSLRLEDIDLRIAYHERNIKTMINLAKYCKDSRQRLKIAQEIGYSRIEIDCHLKPLRERIENGTV